MSINNVVNKTVSIDGKNFTQQINVTANGSMRREATLAAAKVGQLTTRTNTTDGTLTMAAGHGITTGQKLHLYWVNTDATIGTRRNVTVGTVATNSVPISGGAGDNLPANMTNVTAQVPTTLEFEFTGDNLQIFAATANGVSQAVLADGSAVEKHHVVITQSGQIQEWYAGDGTVNPVAGQTIAQLIVSNGDSSGSKVIKVSVGIN